MQAKLKRHMLLATVLSILWACFVLYSYLGQQDRGDVLSDEMRRFAKHNGDQIVAVFNWFEENHPVFLPLERSGIKIPKADTVIEGSNGMTLAKAIPIVLASKLEEHISNGVNIRFVSNSPLNPAHLPSTSVNGFLIQAIESDSKDFFDYREEVGLYSYVRPLTATKSCIACHTALDEGGLIGALVIDIDKQEFINSERTSNDKLLIANALASFIIVLALYFILVDIWRRHLNQSANAQHAHAIATNMSQEIELVVGNMSHILEELKQDNDDPKKTALFQSLQAINKNLLDTSFKLQAGDSKSRHEDEEIFHVQDFFEQCTQIFYPQCMEKQIELDIDLDISVPTYLLGNTYYLRQAVGRLLKNSVMYTNKGSVKIRVRSAVDMPSRFRMQDLNNLPIHLIIEVEDSSNGFLITNNQNLLKTFASSFSRGQRVSSRPVISLSAINELAEFLGGNVTTLHNTKRGACFKLVVQMKMIEESQSMDLNAHKNEPQIPQIDYKAVQQSKKEAHDSIVSALSTAMRSHVESANNKDVITSSNLLVASAEPISVILVDAGNVRSESMLIWEKAKINLTHMTHANQVTEAIANPHHGYSIIFIYNVADVDMFYLATRIRYAENPDAKPVAIVLIANNIIRTDMEVMRFFNVSTVENFEKDPHVLIKIAHLVMQTHKNKIFQGGSLLDKTDMDEHSTKLFDMKKAIENAKNDKQLLRSICSMWIRFYPRQVERLNLVIEEGDEEEVLRFLRSVKNSASTVSLPMLWAEAHRLEKLISEGKSVRYEKLFSIYEQSFKQLKSFFEMRSKKQTPKETHSDDATNTMQ